MKHLRISLCITALEGVNLKTGYSLLKAHNF
jgi:hypothetical protein